MTNANHVASGERRVDVFFYGLFMDAELLRMQGFDPREPRLARVDDMALRLGSRATLVPARGAVVHGMLMRLTHAEIDRPYAEPSVAAYRAEPVVAASKDGGTVAALCFNLPEAPADGTSNPAYAAKLVVVARRLGLPDAYIESIKCLILRSDSQGRVSKDGLQTRCSFPSLETALRASSG